MTITAVQAGIAQALVNLRFAVDAGVARSALALIAVDLVDAIAIKTGVGGTLVDVMLAVGAVSAFGTAATITVVQIFASSSVFARRAVAFVDLPVA